MNKTQRRQMAKGRAFNRILKLYHPKSNWLCPEFPRDETYGEKKESKVRDIMGDYFRELKKINYE